VEHVRLGNHPNNKRRKRVQEGQCWKSRSILWDLPYWSTLKLRHNLDVMHIEKNICEALLGTLLDIAGKSKDSISARLDLEDMGIRKKLHLKANGNSYSVPHAPYKMTKAQISAFCAFIKNVKLPDGYASNLARCVSVDECKVQALKTHDCHILLQRILPVGLRGIMHKEICEAIAELGNFFQQICAKKLKLDILNQMRGEIPIIMCKLEKIFPPAFFDVMEHLCIHLIDDAILRGPVQYGWMYPVERRLLALKRFVRNMARPEGSIAEAYMANECMTACSRYFDDVDTRHNREGRNKERVPRSTCGLSIFHHGANLLGAPRLTYDAKDYDRMVWIYRKELETAGNRNVEGNLAKEFPGWFRKYLATQRFVNGEQINEDLYALASLPDLRLRIFSGCIVDGVRYHTVECESSRRTQNSGVMVEGSHNGEDIDFYGQLKEVLQLQYNSDASNQRTVVLFKCDWFDTCSKKSRMKNGGYFKSISHGSCWYKDDAFILATQATKVFYLDDNKHGEPWKVVQKFSHRHLWNVNEEENEDMQEGGVDLTYQDDEQEISQVEAQEGCSIDEQPVNEEDGINVEASLVDQIRRQREPEVEEHDLYNEDDDTLGQYDSENECGSMIPVDDGEYSDVE